MIHLDGHKSNNIFVGEFIHALDSKGRVTIRFQMEDFRRRQYLPGSSQPKWLRSLSSKDDRAIGGEGFRGQSERPQSTVALDGIVFKGRLIRLRQAGKDKFKRQAIGACGDRGEGSISWQVDLFLRFGRKIAGKQKRHGMMKGIFLMR